MPETFTRWAEWLALAIDALGALVIVGGMAVASARYLVRHRSTAEPYRRLREDLGRGILLGLEFLVAADIIRTVAVEPTLEGVLVLGLIVLIRTFLSMALEVELEGRLPWRVADARDRGGDTSRRAPSEEGGSAGSTSRGPRP